jgi:type II secretory pathway component PulK
VLIVTIWVIMVLTGLVFVFARTMRVSAFTAANTVASQQAETLADGARHCAQALVESAEDLEDEGMDDLYEAVHVGQGYFWLLRPDLEDDKQNDYGLIDESSKVNLNSASLEMLQRLPGMTAELAASIIDWRDEDSDLTEGGAESESYLLQADPYECKNAPLETVEEILLIQGGSKDILFGEDTNNNGRLDDNENDGDDSEPADNQNGSLERGLYDYVTVYSAEKNVDAEGNARVNINEADNRSQLNDMLTEAFDEDRALAIMSAYPMNPNFDSILHFYYRSSMTPEEFEQIADKLSTSDEDQVAGLVNVNRAPKPVLMCLPGLEESDVDQLMAQRASSSTEIDSIAWVVGVLDQDKAQAIGEFITTNSYQYRADIVSVSENGRAFRRYVAVLDTLQTPTRVKYWKSLTHMGWPLDREILETLRSGKALD